MIIFFILGLILGAFAVVFALQNVTTITITFFAWEMTGSLAILIIMAILSGILITLLIILPESVNNYFKNRKLKKEIAKLEEQLRKQKELTVFAKNNPPSSETIREIENGAIIN